MSLVRLFLFFAVRDFFHRRGFVPRVGSFVDPETGAVHLALPKIMKYFNWKVEPIDPARELRGTRTLGGWLTVLAVLLGMVTLLKF